MNNALPILYGSPLSPFVRKVAVLLEEKGITFEWKPVRPHDRDETFSRISPLGKIPAYKDERVELADSSVICFYLEKTYPQVPLYPTDTIELAKALWFEEYFDGAMITPLSAIYLQKFFNPTYLDKPTDEKLLKEAMEITLPPMFAYLESQLKPDEWMVGNRFSIADISLAGGFAILELAHYSVDPGRYPKFATYVRRVLARPSFAKGAAFAQEFVKKMDEKLAAARKNK